MRRKGWIAIRRGIIMPYFYLGDSLAPTAFCDAHEVTIAGPVNVDAPPPPTDMVPMGGKLIWANGGYIELLK